MPTYYDDDGNPIQNQKTYYDDEGNPISGTNVPGMGTSVADTARQRMAAIQADAAANPATSVAEEWRQTGLGGLATGALKGVGNTVYNLGRLAHKIPGMDVIAPDRAGAFEGGQPEMLEPTGGAQKAGYLAEQVGEFFVPAAATAGKLAGAAKLVGKAGLAGRMATEAASAAGVTAAQGGDPVAAGVVGGAVPAVSAVAGKVAPAIMNTKIGARAKQFRRGADPGAGVVDEGLVAGTAGGMFEKVDRARHEVGVKIGDVLAKSPKATNHPINIAPFIDNLIDDAVRSLETAGKGDAAAAVSKIREGMYAEFARRGSNPSKTNAKELWEISQQIKDAISYGSDPAIDAGAEAIRKSIRTGISKVIGDVIPAIKPLNQRYANLAEAQAAIKAKMDASHGIASFARNPVNWIVGGVAGYHMDDPAKAAAILGMKAGLTSMPAASGAAQLFRGAGSNIFAQGAARAGAAGVSQATRPTIEDLVEQYGQQ